MGDSALNHPLMLQILTDFDPQPEDATLTYLEVLWRVQGLLAATTGDALVLGQGQVGGGRPLWNPKKKADPIPAAVPGDARAASVYAALDHFDPQPGDRRLYPGEAVQRLQVITDRELHRWSSRVMQWAGPSGAMAVAPPPYRPGGG